MLKFFGAQALVFSLLVAVASAQVTIGVSPDPVLIPGSDATITISGGQAGGSVTVTIDNGGIPGEQQTITIPLDNKGSGKKSWKVPLSLLWGIANFNAPGAHEITRFIELP